MNETLIKLGGFYNILLIIFHVMFWRIFNWREDLKTLSFLNKAIMQVINISLTLVFAIFSYISLAHTNDLLSTPLGNALLSLIALFWFARAAQQVIFFKLKHWSSWAFMFFFVLGGVLYGVPVVYSS